MRPRYESDSDRKGEADLLSFVCRRWDCTAEKLSDRYELDYLLLRNGVGCAWLELKIRTNAKAAYPTYMISFGKIMAARRLSGGSKLPSFLAVQWTDGIHYTRLDEVKRFEVAIGGRRDRDDAQDIEPVILIPMDDFIPFKSRWQ
jgi:hypothetical protein